MRVVVTGREGQVARASVECARSNGLEVVTLARPALDLAGPTEAIVSAVKQSVPDLIVSAAAYTQVDKAESEPDLAFAVNERGPAALARAARELNVPLVHLSTDYVFDGSKSSPYVEEDETGPTGVYGASKLAGERAILAEHPNSAVLRTAWVYSEHGSNFVKTMLRLASDRDVINVVDDQRGNPTSAADIAKGIFAVAKNLASATGPELRGVFHMTGRGEASWAEFARAIFEESVAWGGPTAQVRPISTADYPTAATRPANSRLDSAKLERVHGVRLPEWRSSLKDVVQRLINAGA